MQVLVDSSLLELAADAGTPLGAIIERVQAMLTGRRRVVQRILVDGQAMPADQVEQWLSRPAEQVGRVEFQTACPRALARQTLAAVNTMLTDTASLQKDAAEKLAAGQTRKAMELLLGCLNHFKLAQEAVGQAVQLNRLDLDQVPVGEQSAGESIRQLAGLLVEVKTALESRDFVLLGDLLCYEFPKSTQQWSAIVGELDRRLAD